MRKCICLFLAMVLLMGCEAVSSSAESTLADFFCAEERFSTRVPAAATAGYEENNGLVIYTDASGYIPYVIVHRRSAGKKFNDPVNYLNNVYREYIENKYGDGFLGMNPAKTWEIGGKELLGARYMFKVGEYTVVQLQLIEIRDAGDVEYTAKYVDGKDEATLAALDTAVRYFRETDTETSAANDGVLRPADYSGEPVNTNGGIYRVRLKDTEKIMDGGYFTAALYVQDEYDSARVEALQPGHRVQVAGAVYTVKTVVPHEDGSLEIYVEEDFDGYIAFMKGEGVYTALVNDWSPSTFLTDYKVTLPLQNLFQFAWFGGDGSETDYNAEQFVSLMTDPEKAPEITQYNTAIGFLNDAPVLIYHTDYPEGPETED